MCGWWSFWIFLSFKLIFLRSPRLNFRAALRFRIQEVIVSSSLGASPLLDVYLVKELFKNLNRRPDLDEKWRDRRDSNPRPPA
jgi:hypothetical protein